MLVVGLGNPTAKYRRTRHNVGREFVEQASSQPGFIFATLDCFMNESGGPVKGLLRKHNLTPDKLVVVVDDFMIPFGTLRLRSEGSSGGHNGLNSIIDVLQTKNFPRLRVGVGPVPEGQDPADFVLERFTKQEDAALPKMFEAIQASLNSLAADGVQKAMSFTNKTHL